jgi:Mg-chelatase subunit ChlD
VEQRGGGLITATGGHAVTGQPDDLRSIEPIRPPRAVPDPRPLEIIFVIDRSSSMSGGRIASARGGAMAAIQQLREDARAGVVSFSDGVDGTMGLVGMDARATLIAFTMHLRASGGTDLSSGLRGARRMLSGDPRYLHHVVLLSDGESDPGPALAAAQSVASAGATLSAITIGPYSELMASIARIGRGRYHVTSNAGSLPSLMVREAQYRQPPPSFNGSFTPTVARRMAFVEGLDLAHDPPLTGHALCETRSGAETVLTATGESPLLAHWYVGAGQVATWTSSVEGRWSDGFRASPDFRTLWTRMAWDLLRQRTEDPVELVLERSPERPDRVRVSAVTARASDPDPPRVARPVGAWSDRAARSGSFRARSARAR